MTTPGANDMGRILPCRAFAAAIATRLELHRVIGRCRACGNTAPVFSLHRDAV
jgi:hypothetical protein